MYSSNHLKATSRNFKGGCDLNIYGSPGMDIYKWNLDYCRRNHGGKRITYGIENGEPAPLLP